MLSVGQFHSSLFESWHPTVEPTADCVLLLGESSATAPKAELSLVVYEPSLCDETVIGRLNYRQDFASVLLNGTTAIIRLY